MLKKAKKHARKTTRYVPAKSVIRRPFKKTANLLLSGGFGDRIGYNSVYDQYEAECRKYNAVQTDRVAKYFYPGSRKKRTVWKREWFDHSVELPFEFLSIPVPAGYQEFLRAFFGEWEKPAQVKSVHGDVIFDTSRSYLQYFEDIKGKAVR